MEIKLNLIPPKKKADMEKNKYFKFTLRLEIMLLVVLGMFLGVLVSFLYILRMNSSIYSVAQEDPQEAQQYEKIKELDNNFISSNSQISKLRTIRNDQINWSNVLTKLNEAVFPGIILSSFSNDDYLVTITGQANTRDNLILLKDKLQKDDCFSNVNLPLSNLVGKSNVDFQIDFEVNKDCLKKI